MRRKHLTQGTYRTIRKDVQAIRSIRTLHNRLQRSNQLFSSSPEKVTVGCRNALQRQQAYVKEPPSTHHVPTVSQLLMIAIDSDRNRILPRKADKGHPTCTHGAVARLRQLEANGYHEVRMFLAYLNQPSLVPPPRPPLSRFSVSCSS